MGNGSYYKQFPVADSHAFKVIPISHVIDDSVYGPVRPLRQHCPEMRSHRFTALQGSNRQSLIIHGSIQNLPILLPADFTDANRILLINISGNFIINLKKQLRILRIHGKADHIPNIQHHSVSKKRQFCIANPVRYFLSLQQIYERQRIFIIPVKHCCLRQPPAPP